MKAFYILKPDIFDDIEALKYYIDFVNAETYVNFDEFYEINDWVELSRILYEPRFEKNDLRLFDLRKKIMSTIIGYNSLYKNKKALLSIVETSSISDLQKLYDFKKELRRKYVYNKKMYYLEYQSYIDFDKKLIDIDINEIKVKISCSRENMQNYNEIFLNKIHFPDPNIESVNEDAKCLVKAGIINKL